MEILTYRIQTCMGQLTRFGQQLGFLTDKELLEFNTIGYTGKNSKGEKIYRGDYLNSLGKGQFRIDQIKFDSGDFTEEFNVIRVI